MPPGVLADLLSAQKDWLKQLEGSRGPGFAALLVWAAFLTRGACRRRSLSRGARPRPPRPERWAALQRYSS